MTKLSDREQVVALISTIPDKHMKDILLFLQERYVPHRTKYMLFNREGIEAKAPEGKVRLRPYQYERLVKGYGEQGFHILVEYMWDYLDYLEKNWECIVNGKKKLKELSVISHYHIMGKGWVAQKFEHNYPQYSIIEEPDEDMIDFFDIENKSQAIKYIQQTPPELRFDNQEITYLVNKYDIKEDEI